MAFSMSTPANGIGRFQRLSDIDKDKLIYAGDLSKYGQDFQIKLLALLLKDRIFTFSILPIIKDEYFSDVWLRKIFISIREYSAKYVGSLPTIENIKIDLRIKGEKLATYEKILLRIEEMDLSDRDFVMDNSRRFCFSKHALIKMDEMKILLEQGDFEKAQSISVEAFKHAGLDNRKIYNLKTDYEKIYQDDNLHRPIPTPFPSINRVTKGGPGNGNLVILVAPSNFGKTTLLIAASREANRVNKNVAFFSFEIGGIDIIRKYIAGRLGINQENLAFNKDTVRDFFINNQLGDFRLIEQRATRATVDQIKMDLDYLKSTGFFPDMICVDSLNQLKLFGDDRWRMKDDNQKFEYLAEELRDLANDLEIPVYTVLQTNRTGFVNSINDITTIGKAIEPLQVADVLMTFAQTPEMHQEGKCIALLAKNRLGPKNMVLECSYDPNQGTFTELAERSELLLLNNEQKQEVKKQVGNYREQLRMGKFDPRGKQ
jgi:hypothetical protein